LKGNRLEIINKTESEIDSIIKLLKAIRYDQVINKKIAGLLKMDAYPRRLVLNNWLEQLRLNKAPQKLTKTLSLLFDDSIAEKVNNLINRSKVKK